MKQPLEWNVGDIDSLIVNKVQEHLGLEYKACAALANDSKSKSEVSKDVSAFANSAGGTILYGVNEKDHLPTSLDVGYDQMDITKEWLEQVINSNIQRRIDGIRINPVALKTGKCIYVVSIPQSMRAPHMAKDNKYYKRFNFQSVPMEDYEVRDVARRQEAPDLRLKFELISPEISQMQIVELKITLSNLSVEPSQYAVATVFLAHSIEVMGHVEFQLDEVRYQNNRHTHTFKRLQRSWGPPLMPIWAGQDFPLGESIILGVPWANIVSRQSSPIVGWQITSPKMAWALGKSRPVGVG
jgi:hypothetical protein